ncbi:MAG: RNA methyltransferase [Spirochaetales bacterium]|nr:RNA methyltransferase [Spirochaetales bacterium]
MDYKLLYEKTKHSISTERLAKIHDVSRKRTRHISVILEDIHYTQNISAVIRSCDCFGVQDLTIMGQSSQRVNKHVSLGASQWVDLHRRAFEKKENVLKDFQKRGYLIYAACLDDKAQDLNQIQPGNEKIALVMGNEAEGISPVTRDLADHFIKIPMYGFSNSFNISVSAAIILNHLVTKLRESEISWQLSDDELVELRYRWIKSTLRQGDRIERILERELAHPNDQ